MSTTLIVSPGVSGQTSLLDVGKSKGPATTGGRARARPTWGPGRSLDDLIVDTWEGLVKGESQCPVCGGRMEPEWGAHARPVGGRCADCGSALH
jgi:hypothetical protein